MGPAEFGRLYTARTAWAWFRAQGDVGRFEYDETDDPWAPCWESAWLLFHDCTTYADPLLARAYLTARGVAWIALWDMAEMRPGYTSGHATLCDASDLFKEVAHEVC